MHDLTMVSLYGLYTWLEIESEERILNKLLSAFRPALTTRPFLDEAIQSSLHLEQPLSSTSFLKSMTSSDGPLHFGQFKAALISELRR